MKNVLVTGGTVFVSKYVAKYYVEKGYQVYVLNRNTKEQVEGVTLLQADRHKLGDTLRGYHFDVVMDITAYTASDINALLDALDSYDDYIFISSSAVYPEHCPQPFTEDTPLGENRFWGKYGTDKIKAEQALLSRVPNAYILRPPYLYGPMNDVYREAFVFDCALAERAFFLPGSGEMNLQFFHVEDLCRFMDILLQKKPATHIFNVGNKEQISVRDWVNLCYKTVGVNASFCHVPEDIEQRNYFCFAAYDYYLDILAQDALMPETKSLEEGLRESLDWYLAEHDSVEKRPYLDFIENNLVKS